MPPATGKPPWRPAIHWQVVAEHLSEATFLWKLWERSLVAADHTLRDVAEGDEQRLLANLEGLVIGGRRVAERLLLPCLEEGEEPAVCAAAASLLAATDTDWLEPLLGRLEEGSEPLRRGVLRALALSGREDVTSALSGLLPRAEPDLQVLLLDALRARCADPGVGLALLEPESPAALAAAIRAARFAPREQALALVHRGLEASETSVAEAALETGLVLGLSAAWRRSRQSLETQPGAGSRTALLALAAGGGPRDIEALAARAAAPRTREEALWALGFSGRLDAAEAVLRVLQGGDGRLAVESFALITGLPLAPPFVEEEEEEVEVGGEGEEATEKKEEETGSLLSPGVPPWRVDVDAVTHWWSQARGRFERTRRHVLGRPLDVGGLLLALEEVSMRRRRGLLLDLAIRSGGACAVEPRGWAAQQRQQAGRARGLRPMSLVHSYDELLTA